MAGAGGRRPHYSWRGPLRHPVGRPVLTQLLDVFSFLSVLLRGATLALASLVMGGAIFSLWILKPLHSSWGPQPGTLVQPVKRLVFSSAVALALVQSCYVAADCAVLAGTTTLHIQDVAGANFFLAGVAAVAA